MNIDKIFYKALQNTMLSMQEALFLYHNASVSELIYIANEIRNKLHNYTNKVTWMIDRNVNITNVCIAQCKFCNFCCKPNDINAYVTSIEEYEQKIDELFRLGGNQLLLQGGLNPELRLSYYKNLFKELKKRYPQLKLHALGPPEVVYLSKLENLSYFEVLEQLIEAGLDSLPGSGAEILSDRVRKIISPAKCSTQQWLDVMRAAHRLGLTTSATMMLGHVETIEERIEHLFHIRNVQAKKPETSYGFIAFIPWPFQHNGTLLNKKYGVSNVINSQEYIRIIAISRIILTNIKNIQASWLTVGKETAQLCLHSGANDMGSIMIEENVVSSAGASHKFDERGICKAISEAGFIPQKRNQNYQYV